MGKSPDIEKKMAEDQKFRTFMDEIGAKAKIEEEKILGQIDEVVKKQYESNGWDHARLFGNRQSDYQNYSDWSLDRINAIIQSIGNALVGGDYPSAKVPGSEEAEKSTIEKAKDFLGAFGGDYSLVIARVQALIAGALAQFTTASSVSSKTSLNDMPLSGGLHLFFGSSGSLYTNNTFFTNQFIGSFQIVFEVYMSVAEARAIGLQQILVTTSSELDILNKMIIDIRVAQAESLKKILKEDPGKYATTYATYKVAIDAVKEDRDILLQEYTKYNQVAVTVDSYYSQLDLSEFGVNNAVEEALSLDHLFNEWEAAVARRYIREKISLEEPAVS